MGMCNRDQHTERTLAFDGIDPVSPLWPPTPLLVCLVGCEPAQYLGDGCALVSADQVCAALVAFDGVPALDDVGLVWRTFLHGVATRGDAMLVGWAYR